MCPILGPLVPLFWISGDISSGFQSQSGFCLIFFFFFAEANCNVHSPTSTSSATPTNLLHRSFILLVHLFEFDVKTVCKDLSTINRSMFII